MNKRQGYTMLPVGPTQTYTIPTNVQIRATNMWPIIAVQEQETIEQEAAAATVYAAFPPEESMETDDELRRRIAYVAGEAELVRDQRLGMTLDAIAERYGLKRREPPERFARREFCDQNERDEERLKRLYDNREKL